MSAHSNNKNGRAKFPIYRQHDQMDCGPTCLRMIASYHGRAYPLQYLREHSFINRDGVSLLGISQAAESIGLRSRAVRGTFEALSEEATLPCIAHWNQRHFIVIHKIKNGKVYVADPGHGLLTYSKDEFLAGWLSRSGNGREEGALLLLEPAPDFYREEEQPQDKASLAFLLAYLRPYKKFLTQLLLGVLLGSLLQLIFPFLTQSLVDAGINNQNLGFVYTILLAQLMLFLGRTFVDFIRSWIFLHLGTRINISIISDFLIKLLKLPLAFFDSKMIGDILRRINDHERIEEFLTATSFNTLVSLVNLLVFGLVLALYSASIFIIFLIGSAIYLAWIWLFMSKRRDLDYKRFNQLAGEQGRLIELVHGIQDIKLNNCERQKRWEWENIQARLFKVNVKSLALSQYQQSGTLFINELKNIIITFLAAKQVIDGDMTLGMMMAVAYIIGQLNGPLEQLVQLFHTAQDAKISLERLAEVHAKDDEEDPATEKIAIFPEDRSLRVRNVSFQYEGPKSPYVLRNQTLDIPQGKVTAFVGVSGSGKTTLLKLLLKCYPPTAGEIKLGNSNLANFNAGQWRQKCGVVMQDSFIFSDTIARNIALGEEWIDKERLLHAVKVANIQAFIESLPLSYTTKIGGEGLSLSQGQKQRLLIARAVYKNPEYLFFDEATNALDAENESIIMKNLGKFFEGKTVVIVAHRLSTVKHADQIAVIDDGQIVETGTHTELTNLRGKYYHLVKNQLELGN